MTVSLELEPTSALPVVEYRWDAGTDILSAELSAGPSDGWSGEPGSRAAGVNGVNGSVAVEGEDGSWLTLDLDDGCVRGVQVAVWPPVRRRSALEPPTAPVGRARLALPSGSAADMVLSLEVNATLRAEVGPDERHFHFVLGPSRPAVNVAIATDIVLELDDRHHLSGLWLLNVPPAPVSA
ncbi:MAG: hypothetical protein ACYC2G_03290 [Gemmatimonadaceae bacterium]